MSASAALSVELWQTILRYAIGVAEFLDPDAFEGVINRNLYNDTLSSKRDEAAYWRAEKTLNALQRVSKSWGAYLRPYEHRFVRILDVRHQRVGLDQLKRAIRVSFGRYEEVSGEGGDGPRTFENFCWKTVAGVEGMDMQIADMMREEFLISKMIDLISNFRQLKTLLASGCIYESNLIRLVGGLPNIRHLYSKGFRGALNSSDTVTFNSRTLVTLSFHIRNGSHYDTIAWKIPSLRHLRLKDEASGESMDSVKNMVVPILRSIGHQLLSLGLYLRCHGNEPLPDIWDLCPRLEIFHGDVTMDSPPPFFHPINTLVIRNPHMLDGFRPPPEWPNLRKIVIDRSCDHVQGGKWLTSMKSRPDVKVTDKWGLPVVITEKHGETADAPSIENPDAQSVEDTFIINP